MCTRVGPLRCVSAVRISAYQRCVSAVRGPVWRRSARARDRKEREGQRSSLANKYECVISLFTITTTLIEEWLQRCVRIPSGGQRSCVRIPWGARCAFALLDPFSMLMLCLTFSMPRTFFLLNFFRFVLQQTASRSRQVGVPGKEYTPGPVVPVEKSCRDLVPVPAWSRVIVDPAAARYAPPVGSCPGPPSPPRRAPPLPGGASPHLAAPPGVATRA